ncbi:MAG TPA: hypothetical protein VGF50_12930 [Caulobacteraceae bacterium]|jgi:hypothetical protein
MKLGRLITAAAILALCASAAQAAKPTHNPRHRRNQLARSIAMNAPPQPVAYSKLDAYEKASPKEQASGDWGLGGGAAAEAPH